MQETLTQNDAQVIVERILITADTMGNSFSSSSFTGGSNQQLDTWAAQACGCVHRLFRLFVQQTCLTCLSRRAPL